MQIKVTYKSMNWWINLDKLKNNTLNGLNYFAHLMNFKLYKTLVLKVISNKLFFFIKLKFMVKIKLELMHLFKKLILTSKIKMNAFKESMI